ncbi:type II toxin-antitoxin system PemK/MazF family toxin [Thioalkalivibrio sp. ALJT]|uniref:type II toxin-antitoxin system PemK/MazF family toxin n=1 Tax=Thioalkalivibrio sp. ALJT TaxID=1158146 RepID=UPI001E50E282|nr:type II toxin-antitoxin system PemK/MazF family toxin [Thioalkalivibrio sp. ALJT]
MAIKEVPVRRGEVWVARLNPNHGREIGKTRPVLVLQANALIRGGLPTILVAPFSTQFRKGLEPLRVPISARDRLLIDSWVCVEQLRALDASRFGEGPLASLSRTELQAVEGALLDVLGIALYQ